MNFTSENASVVENIRHMMLRRKITTTEMAAMLNMTRQNLNKKFKSNNFNENDLRDIATALGYEVMICFVEKEKTNGKS